MEIKFRSAVEYWKNDNAPIRELGRFLINYEIDHNVKISGKIIRGFTFVEFPGVLYSKELRELQEFSDICGITPVTQFSYMLMLVPRKK